MTTNATARRLRRAVEAYAPGTPVPTRDHLLTMEIRADGYSNAHVEGEHESNGLCSFTGKLAARDCGEAGAAAEYVETTDFTEPGADLPRGRSTHAACTHDTTKAARAACRRASRPAAIEEN